MADDVWARTAARFRKPVPRWPSPGALAARLDVDWRPTAALSLIDQALVDVAEGRCKRLMIMLPPQEGKTTLVARTFPLWLLTHRPDMHVVLASYELETAQRVGRGIRDEITMHDGREGSLDLGLRVRRGDHAAARWAIEGHNGGLYSVGIGGALTGRRADLLVLDDPVKDREQAQSSTYRERVWDWWQSVARTRLSPDAAVVLIMTRWHASDLAGKLLADASESWRVLSIPAIADSPDDPLGRAEGEPLVSARGRTAEDWASTRRAVGEYTWASLYQQRPSPLGGGIFATGKIRYWSPSSGPSGELVLDLRGRSMPLSLCWVFLVADLAASVKTSADFTVIVAVAVTPERDLVILDLVRDRMTPDKHFDAARPLFERWRAHTMYIEQMFSTMTLVHDAARAGIPISPLKADSDKVTRALPAAARMEQGRVWAPADAPWLPIFLDELAAFPAGAHDDIADCLAYSARIDSAHYLPPMSAEEERARRPRYDPDVAALDAVFGPEIDLMNQPW